MPQARWIEAKSGLLAFGVFSLIVYGSLYPFQFFSNPGLGGPIRALIETWPRLPNRSDLIANILLYSPFGFFLAQALRLTRVVRILAASLAGLALSCAIEMTQFYDLTRAPELSDIYSNSVGTLLGAIAGAMIPHKPPKTWHPFVLLLLGCWLGNRLYPYVPVPSGFPNLDVYVQTGTWLVIALFLDVLLGGVRGRLAFLFLIPLVLVARALMMERVPPAEVVGGVLAALLWVFWLSRLQHRTVVIAALFMGVVSIQALEPFQFSATPRSFGLIPFYSFLMASRETGVVFFFEKTFTYGVLVWLLASAGLSFTAATAVGAALVMSLRMAQVYLPGRSAEITDVIMLLMLAAMMRLMGDIPYDEKSRPLPGGSILTS